MENKMEIKVNGETVFEIAPDGEVCSVLVKHGKYSMLIFNEEELPNVKGEKEKFDKIVDLFHGNEDK